GLTARVLNVKKDRFNIRFSGSGNFEEVLYRIGKVPLPPYIKRNQAAESDVTDRESYQTVYASQKGAIAAPTAGLHFSKKYLKKIAARGIKIVEITLHVGYGTFSPVRVADIRNHRMHSERYTIDTKAADTINQAKEKGCRIVAVGTTSVRTLEHAVDQQGRIRPGKGNCDLFIYPGYRFKAVDVMLTNFHLPQSTLLMLIAAFAKRQMILNTYREAIKMGYRFYSYGDAMLIE
ncbi:tRNA preQ1(34) S-adenosylmethionine ribosyltransferase-isomerase QueA, partial [Thermodesulfobacteriota bacterium]